MNDLRWRSFLHCGCLSRSLKELLSPFSQVQWVRAVVHDGSELSQRPPLTLKTVKKERQRALRSHESSWAEVSTLQRTSVSSEYGGDFGPYVEVISFEVNTKVLGTVENVNDTSLDVHRCVGPRFSSLEVSHHLFDLASI